jgi:hypothetical protein
VVGFVAQVLHHRQFFRLHLLGDLLQDLGGGHLVRQGRDDDLTVFLLPHGAHLDRARPAFVKRAQFLGRRDDFGVGREIRAPDVFAKLGHGRFGLFEQAHAGGHDLPQIVGRDVGGHADRDAGAAVQQDIGQ